MPENIVGRNYGKDVDVLKTGSIYLICHATDSFNDPVFSEVTFESKLPADFLRLLKASVVQGKQVHLAACRGRVTEHQPESAGHLILMFNHSRWLFELVNTIDLINLP